ncbi:hypothetical protein QKG38_15555 [Clavibacter michiganensis]|uniref:hypothetical protein n=1 Tax=Clavibacter michiganensis TaxID=28447 RepID=UPI001365CC83|nr:hypothetical protein [Clavibacter michiganensis]MDO4019641.1 hypothetical protein [Clavibacter michiganensis]MDO4033321.1 hypothetical protein [Clavibacter michiganensis]MDO4039747.1 hypothetical protein [Clavibacter michiganensis]MDO4042883.1 hypothetical protein [Clavibacter michiganensis]MDO4051676.1 hypothetical protein [Clavibacter michiganensis]
MPEPEKSTYSILYDRLFYAGQHDVHYRVVSDPRKLTFDKLVKLIDTALDGKPVIYATHSFETSNDPEPPKLEGTAVAVTKTHVAYVDVKPDHELEVRVVALTALTALSMSTNGYASLVTNDNKWYTIVVTATFEGLPTITFPGVRSSERNASEFAGLYPHLIEALRTR